MVKRRGGPHGSKHQERSYSPTDVNDYEPTDSENDLDDGEKLLLEKVRSTSGRKAKQKQMAIMDIPSSDEGEDEDDEEAGESDEGESIDMKSDIEGQDSDNDGLPHQKAWGETKRNYYSADYVDKDYGGFDGEDGEAADIEEQEAIAIQKRLIADLEGVDFSLDIFTDKIPAKDHAPVETHEIIKTDLSELSAKEKYNLVIKEAPELPVIAEEFQSTMSNVLNRLQHAAALVRNGQVKSEVLQKYIRTKLDLSLNYSINVSFYLLLRARRLKVAGHPVVRRLVQYRDLLDKLKPLEPIAEKEIDKLLELEAAGKLPTLKSPQKAEKGKLDLVAILKKQKSAKTKTKPTETETATKKEKEDLSVTWEDEARQEESGGRGKRTLSEDNPAMEEDSDEEDAALPLAVPTEDADEKRAITWQIAKNKGLTPRRKKEQRNPRVKNRNRFRKAKIRRKGQVREVRSEIQKYGGEISGIKATVTKSVKFN